MTSPESQPSYDKGHETAANFPDVIEKLSVHGRVPEAGERPARCRALLFNRDGTKVVTIRRNKPTRAPYAVFPGGGLEATDTSALAGIQRELQEELDLRTEEVNFAPAVLEADEQFFYMGVLVSNRSGFTIGGPEAERDPSVAGTYTIEWSDVADLASHNTVPEPIISLIEQTTISSA
jgi:8-oxo-dGTP pyrophosphatase MutT (NUDIX family)